MTTALEALRALLDDPRTDPNAADVRGRRPLSWVERHDPLARALLMDVRTDLTLPAAKEGETGIFIAARKKVWSAVQRFIATAGLPAVEETDREGNTFLHHLTSPTAPRDLFYDKVGDVSKASLVALNHKKETPFHRALRAKNWPLALRLLDTGLLDLHADNDALNWEFLIALRLDAPHTLLMRIASALADRLGAPDSEGWTLQHHVAAMSHGRWLDAVSKLELPDDLWMTPDPLSRRPLDVVRAGLLPKRLRSHERSAWPEPIRWDSGVTWMQAPQDQVQKRTEASGIEGIDAGAAALEHGTLSFYPDARILRLSHDRAGTARRIHYWLEADAEVTRLNGTSPPIHQFNKRHLKLSMESVRQYLHFFCFFVRGEDGPFYLLDDAPSATLSASTTPADRAQISEGAMPTWIIGERKDSYRLLARCFYSTSLTTAYFIVQKTGPIQMEEDHVYLADLSGQVDMPLG